LGKARIGRRVGWALCRFPANSRLFPLDFFACRGKARFCKSLIIRDATFWHFRNAPPIRTLSWRTADAPPSGAPRLDRPRSSPTVPRCTPLELLLNFELLALSLLLGSPSPESQRVAEHDDVGQAHRRRAHHGAHETEHGQRNGGGVVEEGPEEVLLDGAQRRP